MAIWSLRHIYRGINPAFIDCRVIPPEKSSSELFEEFLGCLMGCCFQDYAIAMRVSDGSIMSNRELDPSMYPGIPGHHLWVLLDPVDSKCNIIRTLQLHGVKSIQHAIHRTQHILRESAVLLQGQHHPTTLGELFSEP